MLRTYTNVKEVHVHVCIKAHLTGEFSSITTRCEVSCFDYTSQGCEFESFCGQELVFCIFFLNARALFTSIFAFCKWTRPIQVHDIHPRE